MTPRDVNIGKKMMEASSYNNMKVVEPIHNRGSIETYDFGKNWHYIAKEDCH